MKIRSITAKFILIISILMAFVMAIQLYYNNKTQEDILVELNNLKKSINAATNKILVEKFEGNDIQSPGDSLLWKTARAGKVADIDEDKVVVNRMGKTWTYKNKSLNHLLKSGKMNSFVIIDSLRGNNIFKKSDKWIDSSNKLKFNKIIKNPSDQKVEVVEYDLNLPKINAKVNAPESSWKDKFDDNDVLSFEFPNLVFAREPGKVRYNYSTVEFNKTLDDIRDRNLLLTLGLFGLSIALVATITGKFLKPIKSLNHSFDKVVQGNLDVRVEPKSKDEIGELSASFNHMVSELRKNKDKENIMNRNERLASLGQLAAGVAHEIKNPLNAINLTIEHLNDKFIHAKEKQAIAYIDTIQKEIRRLDKTVNNLLSYLRSENLAKEMTDVNALLDEIFHLFEREISVNHIKIYKNYSTPCLINLDAGRIKTVLMNIITNSIQAMESGGELRVATAENDKSITITDTGQGIPQKNIENIFDLFYTTKSAGTGLGLPTAYKIMQEHGANISISSRENKGTSVLLKF